MKKSEEIVEDSENAEDAESSDVTMQQDTQVLLDEPPTALTSAEKSKLMKQVSNIDELLMLVTVASNPATLSNPYSVTSMVMPCVKKCNFLWWS